MWIICGLSLAGLMVFGGLRYQSVSGEESASQSITSAMPLYLAACVAYFIALFTAPQQINQRFTLWFIILVAITARATMFFSPALEGMDHCRYRWDGAVTASGANPYRYAPQELMEKADLADPEIRQLLQQNQRLVTHINHPQYRTIYPPAAQFLFAAGHLITPFKITGWRIVLLLFDALATLFLILLLRQASQSMSNLAVYCWNPLLIVETYFGSHLDLAVIALVLGVVYLLTRRRTVVAAALLAIASGIKLWPILLVFIVLIPLWHDRRRFIAATLTFSVILLLLAIVYAPALVPTHNSGLLAYSTIWYANAGVYALADYLRLQMIDLWNMKAEGYFLAKLLVGIPLIILALIMARGAKHQPVDLCSRMGTLILLMLLLSPTLFPWYYLVIIPLAALVRRPSLLIWTLLLPLVYVTMHVASHWASMMALIIHLPVWLLLCLEWLTGYQRKKKASVANNA
ncbi:MAG: glycosyltransferase 87 family protein [Planctomycetota bacterium]